MRRRPEAGRSRQCDSRPQSGAGHWPICTEPRSIGELLEIFGDFNGVIAAPKQRLMAVRGVTDKVWVQLRLAEAVAARMARAKVLNREVITSWAQLLTYCKTVMAHRETEQFRVLFLDRKNVLIADEAQGEGTVDHVPVYPREVARRALELNASAIILVHNHPSGDPTPSNQDVEMTGQIDRACRALGITIHDHIIIGKEKDASFKSLGLLLRARICADAARAGAG